ncbi:phosphatase PAP2 family protein [Flavobacterium ammonificans]|jgi:membrane-associated phospholipid phosphatase|uniref:phosphatase PAP2 family protein n=1 Tax=Flavobacterium ammonificans TaxID=1751056 RepID=UPI001E5C5E24|nr:phosphatase PAP2 family protein [Flavobacterium ammonificans]BDB57482.1 phosphatase PAP2 family protein [Flavobacterium ammonificans]
MNKVIGFFIFFFCVSTIHAQNVDIDVLKKININRNTSLDGTFKSISQSAVPISVATPILIYTLGMINNDSVAKQKALFIGETFLASAFITVVSKKIIKTDRPYDTYPMVQPVVSEASYSMPSGHTSTAFATATSLSLAYPKWYVVAPSFVWAGAIGYSRMHLGVHYPSDVLAGAIVGSGSAYLTYKANQWINKKRKKK